MHEWTEQLPFPQRQQPHSQSNKMMAMHHCSPCVCPCMHARTDTQGRRAWHWLCSVPSYWWIALSLFLALEAIAVVGAVYYTRSVQYSSMSQVTEVAKTSARALEKLLEDQKAPILFLSTLIQRVSNRRPAACRVLLVAGSLEPAGGVWLRVVLRSTACCNRCVLGCCSCRIQIGHPSTRRSWTMPGPSTSAHGTASGAEAAGPAGAKSCTACVPWHSKHCGCLKPTVCCTRLRHYPYYEIEACPYGYVGAMEFRKSAASAPSHELPGQLPVMSYLYASG